MKIQCIHFDLDSVLYLPSDFLQSALKLSVQSMIQFGLRADRDEALARLSAIRSENPNANDHFDRLVRHFNGAFDPVIIAAGVEKYWDCKQSNMLSTPHAFFVLRDLSQTYPLSIVSNGIPVKQAGKLIRLGLCPFFIDFDPQSGVGRSRIYASNNPAEMKPHPFLWEKARQELGLKFSQCLMVGDRFYADMLGAKSLGMTTVRIRQGAHRNETKEQALQRTKDTGKKFAEPTEVLLARMEPDYTIDNLSELIEIIRRIEAGETCSGVESFKG